MQFYDAHSHLHFDKSNIVGKLSEEHLGGVVVNGCHEGDWESVIELSLHEKVFSSCGIHPWHISSASEHWDCRLSQLLQFVLSLLLIIFRDNVNLSIGECGLDKLHAKKSVFDIFSLFLGTTQILLSFKTKYFGVIWKLQMKHKDQ